MDQNTNELRRPTRWHSRCPRIVWTTTLLVAALLVAALLVAASPGAETRAAGGSGANVVEIVTEALPPVGPEDRGSVWTRGVGTAPVLSATETRLLEDARAAVALARARNEGSTTEDARTLTPREIEQEKLDRLSARPGPTLDMTRSYPDARPKGE